jgi:hypothetical protein
MNVYLAGNDVKLVVPLTDQDGNALDVSSIKYRVTDANGVELVAMTTLAGFTPSDIEAVISISAALNTLAAGVVRDLRAVELQCVIDSNTSILRASYAIEASDPLVVGVNSFQSLAQAEFRAQVMPNLNAWNAADTQSRVQALIDARLHICQLNFYTSINNRLWGQDSLNFVPEGSVVTNFVANSYLYGGNLSFLTPDQFAKLPPLLLAALYPAQIAEADFILGGSPIEQRRQSGLHSDTIGESRQTFRTGKPLELPVCRRALSYLSMFITFAKRTGR